MIDRDNPQRHKMQMQTALQQALIRLIRQGEITPQGEITEIGQHNAAIVGRLLNHPA